MIRAIAIDDELPALNVIAHFCEKIDFITLEKTFTRPGEAVKYVNRFPVDLLFLDIHMPPVSGIDLYKSLAQQPLVIFTTAYSEFAVEGFNLSAVDYLLKPFTFERFTQAVNRANEICQRKANDLSQCYLLVRAGYSLQQIALSDILYVEGSDDYLKIYLHQQKPVITRMTMKTLLEKLPAKAFARVHRSFIVPLARIKWVRNRIITIGEVEIPIGNSYEEAFFSLFDSK